MKIAILGTRGIPNFYGGFEQFAQYISEDLVKKGQVIAHNKIKPIKAPIDGYLLMPLYQSKGTEGFYLVN